MLPTQTAGLPIVLTQEQVSFIIELCDHDLNIDVQLKLEFARMWNDKDKTISLTPIELRSLINILLKKSENTPSHVKKLVRDIVSRLKKPLHTKYDEAT